MEGKAVLHRELVPSIAQCPACRAQPPRPVTAVLPSALGPPEMPPYVFSGHWSIPTFMEKLPLNSINYYFSILIKWATINH